MIDNKKTKEQLIGELDELHSLVSRMKKEHQRADELIRQSIYSWEETFNNITDMITIHDKDFNIIHANKAAEDILELPLLKSDKAKCYEHYHGESKPPEGCPSCMCLDTKKPVAFEKFEPHLNKFLEIRAMPQFDVNRNLIGVIHIVRDITERKQMENEISSLKKHLLTGKLENEAAFASIITKSQNMRAIFQYIDSVAISRKPVFITGETGVGKELIARSVHLASGLKGNHIAVNVAGLDDTMFSDTLFGHKKGAFTGADKDRQGLIIQASGGTLMLDEIGDLNKSSQVKLLFRKDLYYRLCAHHVHIPPLRERIQDLPLLLDHFIEDASRTMNKKQPAISAELITFLSNYHFPGNVRELQAMLHDAVAQHKSGRLSLDSFKGFIKQRRSFMKSETLPAGDNASSIKDIFGHFPTLKEFEDYLISEAMKKADHNQGSAASLLGITRQALNQRLKKKNKYH
jgi:transcriptional regulator with PAS, ATPase and Fis domain